MPELAGNLNEAYILAGTTAMTGSTGAKISGIDNSTYANLAEMLEITAFGDTYRKRKPGLMDNTCTISGNIYTGDTNGQDVIVAGAYVYIGLYPQGSTVAGKQIPAIVESVETAAAYDGKQTISVTFASNGAPVTLPARS